MNRLYPALVAVALAGGASTPAWAVPPTATPSPGYDARLEEQRRAARATEAPIVQPPRRAKRVKAR
jgi:hypothetical protein